MTKVTAKLYNYRQSPRKVRLVADAVRGKSVAQALDVLSFIPKRAALPIQKLVASALANAKAQELATDTLIIKELMVDAGATLYRSLPRSKGMANPIRKRTSHVVITLEEGKPKFNKARANSNKKASTKSLAPST